MDMQKLRRGGVPGTASLVELPEYIITSFIPSAQPLLARYPRLFRFFGVLLALWYFGPIARLQSLWNQFSSLLVATVSVTSDEDLFSYLVTYIAERRTIRADQSLNAISNPPQEGRRSRRDADHEETARRNQETPKIKYEQGTGMQLFVHQKRLFYVTRKFGEGHSYVGNRYKRLEILSLSCLGRSTKPIKDLIEDIYYMNKDKERSLTIIRRPYSGGYGSRLNWSRLTSKPRRALDTVILDATQKTKVLADVEEYMDEATSTFYGNHGIPYRRGYLFHGPPGVGKTSFALALASRFNLDVYVLTLLDHDLTDSDLISLLNQLPGRSLLLLEDIDTAGLTRKKKSSNTPIRPSRRRQLAGMPRAAMAAAAAAAAATEEKVDANNDSDDDEEGSGSSSRVSLSGLLNAIDGVAAPEGHILIMTTNKPFELDEALVRAGRISVRVEFKNASKVQAEEIFERMYVDLPSSSSSLEDKSKYTAAAGDPVTRTTSTTTTKTNEPSYVTTEDEIPAPTSPSLPLARQFAAKIPDHEFSPADLQDYLLVHKKDPVAAVAEVERWMTDKREESNKRDEEKEAEREAKRVKKDAARRRLREDIMQFAAVGEGKKDGGGDTGGGGGEGPPKEERKKDEKA